MIERHSKVFVPVSEVSENSFSLYTAYSSSKEWILLEEKENVYVLSEQEYNAIQKENKELKEEIERLTKVCNGCFETIHNKSVEIEKLKAVKQNKSNY